jgi:hypothetical protein
MQFTTPTPITAILDIPGGRVQIIAADRTDTTVEIRPADPAKPRDLKAAEATTAAYRDGVLRIGPARPAHRVLGPSGSIEITIQLPAGSAVQATAAAAEFRGVGRLGQVTVDGAYGTHHAIKIDEAAAARLTAHAGHITLGRLTGPAQITTAKGDIRITDTHGGTLDLRTHAGAVHLGATPTR